MTELFENFEVNRDARWDAFLKLLGASVVAHLIFVASVMYVPSLRDAFNIAALIGSTSFVDKDYQRTEIGDNVQLVDIASEKFRYPEGYWAPEGALPEPSPTPLPFLAQVSGPPISFSPAQQPSPSVSPEVTPSPASASTSPEVIAKASPDTTPSPAVSPTGNTLTPELAQTQLEKTALENNVTLPKENEINKKALKDFAAYANDLKNSGKLDFNKPFEIVIEAELGVDGKLKDPKFTKKTGDPNLVDLSGRMISALNDSGFLAYLKPLNRDNATPKVVFTIKQGESELLASVESETSSDMSAALFAALFKKLLSEGASSRAGKDEEVLLKNTTAKADGKKIIFNFTMPRQAVVDLIKKQLAS